MDSINRQQPEDNRADLRGTDAVERIRELVEKAETCFFCTAVSAGGSSGTRPMSVQEVDDEGHLWFLSASDSHKNRELAEARRCASSSRARSTPTSCADRPRRPCRRDRTKIKELWKPMLKTWFTGASTTRASPSSRSRRPTATTGTTSTATPSPASKMLIGAAIGKTLDDSIEGASP